MLIGRTDGPLTLRLIFQPTVAAILAIRAGLKDAREGRTPYLWSMFTNAVAPPRPFARWVEGHRQGVHHRCCFRCGVRIDRSSVDISRAGTASRHRSRHRAVCIDPRSGHSYRAPRSRRMIRPHDSTVGPRSHWRFSALFGVQTIGAVILVLECRPALSGNSRRSGGA